jgi:putative membrane protein
MSESHQHEPAASMRDHLANERTLLSWIRTAVTVVGLGFLLDRLAAQNGPDAVASIAGVILVAFGALVALAGGYSYFSTRRLLGPGPYRSNAALHLGMVAVVVVGAVLVAIYLVSS